MTDQNKAALKPCAYWTRFPDGSGKIFEDKESADVFAKTAYTKCEVIPVYRTEPAPTDEDASARTKTRVEICPGVSVWMTQDDLIAWSEHNKATDEDSRRAYEALSKLSRYAESSCDCNDGTCLVCKYYKTIRRALEQMQGWQPIDTESLLIDNVTGKIHPDDPSAFTIGEYDRGWNDCVRRLDADGLLKPVPPKSEGGA